jgi:hypothetical protein
MSLRTKNRRDSQDLSKHEVSAFVPPEGLEPPCLLRHWDLNPARLPISPRRREGLSVVLLQYFVCPVQHGFPCWVLLSRAVHVFLDLHACT